MSKNAAQVNLLGYQTCMDHDEALKQAFKEKPDDKVAALIKVTLDPRSDYLPLDHHSQLPSTNHLIMLQDGIQVHVVASVKSELSERIKGKK